jgi:hypothetical protein
MSGSSFTAGTSPRQALIVAEFIPHPRGTLRGNDGWPIRERVVSFGSREALA